jgi:hypothetical protein
MSFVELLQELQGAFIVTLWSKIRSTSIYNLIYMNVVVAVKDLGVYDSTRAKAVPA